MMMEKIRSNIMVSLLSRDKLLCCLIVVIETLCFHLQIELQGPTSPLILPLISIFLLRKGATTAPPSGQKSLMKNINK